MEVTAQVDMFINRGSAYEKQVFTKGNVYKYYAESSSFNNHEVCRNEGSGQPSVFNDEEFYKYFKTTNPPTWIKQ